MTTPAAEALYLAQHRFKYEHRKWAVFNPSDKPLEALPVIYGYNNGGSPGWYSAELMAQDGTYVIDCRVRFEGSQTTRRRLCRHCRTRFTTVELTRDELRTLRLASKELQRLHNAVADALHQ